MPPTARQNITLIGRFTAHINAPLSSWWATTPPAEMMARARAEQHRMRWSRFGWSTTPTLDGELLLPRFSRRKETQ